jgi:hypothetical protein
MNDALSSYLLLHLERLGEAAAVIEQEHDRAGGTPIGDWLGRAALELRDDEAILAGILHQRGHREGSGKGVATRLLDQLKALKLSDGTPLDRIQSLESIALAIQGRMMLWRALEEVASRHRELQAIDFGFLRSRASACLETGDRYRLEAACLVFAESLEGSDANPPAQG